MINRDRNTKNLLSYLYIINENDGIDGKFLDKLFHLNRINNKYLAEKMSKDFIYHSHHLIDREQAETLKTLRYYGYIDDNHHITNKGKAYLVYELEKNDWLNAVIDLFGTHYNGEYAGENSTLSHFENVSINCFYQDYST